MKRIIAVCMLGLLVVGCGQQVEEAAPPVAAPEHFVDAAPEGTPMPIPEARQLSPGADVVLKGRVMGVVKPFVDGRALFVLGDEGTVTPCNAMGTDHCATPWDACCDPIEVRVAGTASVQLLGEDGKVLPFGLKGVGGLKELSMVTVAGTVAPVSTADAFVVNASALYVEE